jgi:hypothetical protein
VQDPVLLLFLVLSFLVERVLPRIVSEGVLLLGVIVVIIILVSLVGVLFVAASVELVGVAIKQVPFNVVEIDAELGLLSHLRLRLLSNLRLHVHVGWVVVRVVTPLQLVVHIICII